MLNKITDKKLQITSLVNEVNRLSPQHALGLQKLNIENIKDLFYHFPARYVDVREISGTVNLTKGQAVTIYGIMDKVTIKRSFRGHMPMTECNVIDNSGKIRCIWFNQAYIGKMYPNETRVRVSGVVQEDSRGFFLSNPQIEKTGIDHPEHIDSLFAKNADVEFLTPIYRETKGVSSLFLYTLIKKSVNKGVLENLEDPIPKEILEKLHLPQLKEALLYIHFPKNEKLTVAARKRFAFEEIFYLQIKQQAERKKVKHSKSYKINKNPKELKDFIKSFPFKPTEAQLNAIDQILNDLSKQEPMGRLLEGDVGSGKTFVAAVCCHEIIKNKADNGQILQVAYMAPTEILAKQHFESFIKFFKNTNIEIGLLTSKGCKKFPSKTNTDNSTDISRTQLLKWIKEGKINIVIGTHSLIQKSVEFGNLAFVIIDEQHRFGVKQRKELVHNKSEKIPHLLSMTATPIPRTLALTIFGDLDLTVIDEMPKERKPIITEIVPVTKRKEIYEHIRKELKNKRQVYVVCPRIDEQDEEEKQKRILKSVKEEAERLSSDVFPEFIVDVLHSKMKPKEKEEVMQDFLDKKSDILVATSVVEVGINVPNASVMVIEGADRFGLAQLHQLRGRVGRAEHQSYCYLFTDNMGESSQRRLISLVKSKNGFELAEIDMLNRGIGTLADGKQWGMSDMAMEAIKNPKLVEIAREEAKKIIEKDEELKMYPLLKSITEDKDSVHME